MKYMKAHIYRNIQSRKGSILILVLVVTAILTSMAFSLAYRCRIELKLAGSSSQQMKLYYLAYGGIQRCLALLSQEELDPKLTLKVAHFLSSEKQEQLFGSLDQNIEDTTSLVYWIVDENSYLSLNNSDPSCWENTKLLDRAQIASILDWSDTDNDTNPEGAESDYYERIEPPTTCKNAPILSLKELLHIKGISSELYSNSFASIFSGYSTDSDIADFQEAMRLDEHMNLHRFFSVYGDGKININTVPHHILSILPGLDVSTADTLLAHRSGPDRLMGTEDDSCIKNVSDIGLIDALSELEVELLQQYCNFNSDIFRIYSYAKKNKHDFLLMATVRVIENKPTIITIERLL